MDVSTRIRSWGVLSLFFVTWIPCHAAVEPKSIKDYSLNDTLNRNWIGLQFESAAEQKRLQKEARRYTQFRNASAKSPLKSQFKRECGLNPKASFCGIVQELEFKAELSKREKPLSLRSALHHRREDYVNWLKQAQVEKLEPLDEGLLESALKEIPSFSLLEKLISRLLTAPSCKHAVLMKALSVKADDFFPNEEVRKQIIPLYETLGSCSDSPYAVPARFRASLLYIWQNQCKEALNHLNILSSRLDDPTQGISSYYASRILYWTLSCNSRLAASTSAKSPQLVQKRLIDRYPFSFHALLTDKETPEKRFSFFLTPDSPLQMRVEKNSVLNQRILAAEVLMSIQKPQLAAEVLALTEHDIDLADGKFKLYAAVLYTRLNQYSKSFRLLTSVFEDSPGLISQAALRLSYPQPHPKPIKGQTIVDRHLLLSLIRQESAFNARAQSSAGALGLMQVLPTTAKQYGRMKSRQVLFDPTFNLKVGSKYFSSLLRRYDDRAELALAAYNAGPSRVDQWLKRYPVEDRILFLDLIPFKETRSYVACIARNYYWYSTLYPPLEKVERLGSLFGQLAHDQKFD